MVNNDNLNGLIFGSLLGFTIGLMISRTGFFRPAGKRRPSAYFSGVTFSESQIIGVISMLELKEGQKATLNVALKTAHGHAAAIEPGSARFISTDESIVSVEQNADNELEATVRGLDGSSNGSATIEFRADGKQGEGVREIVGVITVVVTQGDATVVELSPGTPEDDDQADEPQPADVPATDPSNPNPAEDAGKVKAGDPGTATGGPITGDNPNAGTTHPTPEGVAAGNPSNADPNADPKNIDAADRIEKGGPGSVDDPAEGQPPIDPNADAGETSTAGMTFPEAAAKAKETDDNASPSNDVTGPGSPSGSF